ncbi:YcxB family protein [Streptomyces sp. NPDC006172]|uniref:YcxB family protein n=1 Tax=Streptomyces sp. NPDC006172 TaxID=3154470 RepID=UPI00340644F8
MDTRGGDSSHQATGRGAAVEFSYRLTVADFEEALRARARRSPAGRAQVLMGPLISVLATVVYATVADTTRPVWITMLVITLAATSWGAVRGLRTMARRMFSVTESYGQCRMVADDRGAVSTGERVSFAVDWTVYREYLETPGLFVLLGGDRAAAIAVLPKRGAQDPADVERLRAILDRNLKRLK